MKNDVVQHGKQIVALPLNAGGVRTVADLLKEKIGNGEMVHQPLLGGCVVEIKMQPDEIIFPVQLVKAGAHLLGGDLQRLMPFTKKKTVHQPRDFHIKIGL